MYTDGETFYYRPDRPNRVPSRRSRPSRKGADPEAGSEVVRTGGSARLRQLEATVQRLEDTIAELTEALRELSARKPAPRAGHRSEPAADEVGRELIAAGDAPRRNVRRARAPRAVEGGDPQESDEGVRVSFFAGGNATAVPGQVRVRSE